MKYNKGNVVMNTKTFRSECGPTIKHTARGEVKGVLAGLVLVHWFVADIEYWWPNEELVLVNEDIQNYP